MTPTPHCDRFLRDVPLRHTRLTHNQLQTLADENDGNVDGPLRVAASNMWERLKDSGSSEAMLAATGPNLRAARILFDLALANRLLRKEPWAAGCYRYFRDITDPTAFMDLAHQITDAWKASQPSQPRSTPLTAEDRKRVHHLLHALECNYVDVPEVVYEAADTMRKLSESDRLSWKNYLVQVVPSAGQVVWTLGHAAGLLKMSPTSKERGRTHWHLPDPSALLTAIDDTVSLWRAGKLVEDNMDVKQAHHGSPAATHRDRANRSFDALAVDYDNPRGALNLAAERLYDVAIAGPFTWRAYLDSSDDALASLIVFDVGRDTNTIRVSPGIPGAYTVYVVPDFMALREAVHLRLKAWHEAYGATDADSEKNAEPWLDTIPGYS